MSQVYLTVEDVASKLQVHPETIRRWVRAKKIPYFNFNGNTRFDPERLTNWEKSRKVEPRKIIA